MPKPFIAVCPQYDLTSGILRMAPEYFDAVMLAGGLPVLLPLCQEEGELVQIASRFDGLLVPGGPDISPFYFQEETFISCGPICRQRDLLELQLIPEFIRAGKPVFGICRGLQSINIALGGDIYQDIGLMTDSKIQHSQVSPGQEPVHTVSVTPDSLLAQITGLSSFPVNSFHHQAVRKCAPGFEICAVSADGLIEAQYMPKKPFVLGVQWHPELLFRHDKTAFSLFTAFLSACIISRKQTV